MTGGEFKMTLNDTEIKMGVADEGEFSLGLYALVCVEDEGELLLVNGGGCQECRFYSFDKPFRKRLVGFVNRYVLDRFLLRVLHALRCSVAQ